MTIYRKVIPKLAPIYNAKQRYIILWGGRGGGKSFEVARCIIVRILGSHTPLRILCCREIQKSIKQSVHYLLVAAIYDLGVAHMFNITQHGITSKLYDGKNESEIFFMGIKSNTYEIKSLADIDICWVEEAGQTSQDSWDILLPTIRKQGSQVFATFNPTEESAPTYRMFVTDPMAYDKRLLINVNYWDNPFMSETLYEEMERMKRNDYERYLHHWEGKPLTLSYAAIYRGKFEVKPIEIYTLSGIDYIDDIRIQYKYGMDFGFSTDPFATVETFLHKDTIYITRELHHHGLENADIVPSLKIRMPELIHERRKVYADSAYPATISQLSRPQIHPCGERVESLNIEGAVKGAGSIEEGINWIKSYKIIVDVSCKNTIFELNNYKYLTDKVSGEIIPKPEDKNNHCLIGDTIVNTLDGDFYIKDLIGKTGCVWSFNTETKLPEKNMFYNVRQTSESEEIYQIELENGNFIKATSYHPVLTQRGWIKVIDLTEDDSIISIA